MIDALRDTSSQRKENNGAPRIRGPGRRGAHPLPEYDAYDLGLWALKEALADSGLRFEDIDGLIVNRIPDYQRFCEIAGLNPSYVSTTLVNDASPAFASRQPPRSSATDSRRS